jgi:DNA modification methylase
MNIRDRIVELRRVPAGELLPNPKNWRQHPAGQADALRGVLSEVGYVDALLARETPRGLMLLDGHLRAETTPDAIVPVLVVDVTDAEADKILATFDPLSAMAEADAGKLDALLREVETGSESLAAMLDELAKDAGCEWAKENGEVVEDEVPEPPVDPVTKPGDLWLLGEHRLLCGDSTDAATVDRLFAGGRASLLFTSPPYGQQRDYGKAKELVKDWDGLMRGVFQHAARVMEPDGQVLVNLGLIHRDGEWIPYWDGWIAWMREQGWRRFGWYVWDQGSGLPGDWNGRLAPSHEFVFHFNRSTVRPRKSVAKKATSGPMGTNIRSRNGRNAKPSSVCRDTNKILDSVIRANRNSSHGTGHPATFPVTFAAAMLEAWPGLTYEPFAGSGTTIIAAEQLNRRCYAIEIEPRYVDVCIQRWETLTGRKAELA